MNSLLCAVCSTLECSGDGVRPQNEWGVSVSWVACASSAWVYTVVFLLHSFQIRHVLCLVEQNVGGENVGDALYAMVAGVLAFALAIQVTRDLLRTARHHSPQCNPYILILLQPGINRMYPLPRRTPAESSYFLPSSNVISTLDRLNPPPPPPSRGSYLSAMPSNRGGSHVSRAPEEEDAGAKRFMAVAGWLSRPP